MRTTVVLVMSSLYRPHPNGPDVTLASLQSAASCTHIDAIYVHGYTPVWQNRPSKVVTMPIPTTPIHNAYRWLPSSDVPRDVLSSGNKRAVTDSLKQSQWRSQLNLDAWHALNVNASVVIWLENDGVINCKRMGSAISSFIASEQSGAACYGKQHAVYEGGGAVCMMFRGNQLAHVRQHILAYHMVQPFDWLLNDYANGQWTTYDVATHGIPGKRHLSTKVL